MHIHAVLLGTRVGLVLVSIPYSPNCVVITSLDSSCGLGMLGIGGALRFVVNVRCVAGTIRGHCARVGMDP